MMYEQLTNSETKPAPITMLDPAHPVDRLLMRFCDDVNADHLPTLAEQKQLIAGLQQGDADAARALLQAHGGLVAAVVYPFRGHGIGGKELLVNGAQTFMTAAKTYSSYNSGDFNDHAITVLEDSLGRVLPEDAHPEIGDTDKQPMERIVLFAMGLTRPELPDYKPYRDLIEGVHKREELMQLTPRERKILPFLHLPGKEISQRTDVSIPSIRQATLTARKKLGAKTRVELAFAALDRGVRFDVKAPPPLDQFTLRERQVAANLAKRNPEIATELGLGPKQTTSAVQSLLFKTQARTRTELALIARMYDFEPSPEELDDHTPEALKAFTPFQRPIVQLLHLPTDEIAERLNCTKHAVASALVRAEEIVGVRNKAQLAVALFEQGLSFDVHAPERPLAEVLNSQEMQVASSIELPYQVIAENTGLDEERIAAMAHYIKYKTGARSRAELALIIRTFDTGERRDIDTSTPRERLAKKLGLTALSEHDLESLLGEATPKQRAVIVAYYLTDEQASWRDIGEQFGTHRISAMTTARRGIEKMRQALATNGVDTLVSQTI